VLIPLGFIPVETVAAAISGRVLLKAISLEVIRETQFRLFLSSAILSIISGRGTVYYLHELLHRQGGKEFAERKRPTRWVLRKARGEKTNSRNESRFFGKVAGLFIFRTIGKITGWIIFHVIKIPKRLLKSRFELLVLFLIGVIPFISRVGILHCSGRPRAGALTILFSGTTISSAIMVYYGGVIIAAATNAITWATGELLGLVSQILGLMGQIPGLIAEAILNSIPLHSFLFYPF
jgi:hypothetical protein